MDKLDKLNKVLSKFDTFELLKQLMATPKIRTWVLVSNKMQMYELGEDARGRQLGEYAPSTVIEKLSSPERDHRIDHITLKDYGDFYSSMQLLVENTFADIIARTEKPDGTDLTDKFGEDILGLNDENMERLKIMLTEEMTKMITNKLLIEL